jgi:ATP-dependent Clp protease ATP-binding subunit ClpA
MFERFTDRARRVVVLAQEEARMLNHNYIGTEHILLGLIHEGEGVAAKGLQSLGILKAFVHKLKKLSVKDNKLLPATFPLLLAQRRFSNFHFVKRSNWATITSAPNIFSLVSSVKEKALLHKY